MKTKWIASSVARPFLTQAYDSKDALLEHISARFAQMTEDAHEAFVVMEVRK